VVSVQALTRRNNELQQALAASQQDLTRALAQRDEFVKAADELHGSWLDLKAEIARLRDGLAAAQTARLATERERDTLRLAVAIAGTARRDVERDRNEARHDLAHAEFEIGKLRAQLDHLRSLLPNPTSTEEGR
jgi:uncharacterized protein (DUF3084 family)